MIISFFTKKATALMFIRIQRLKLINKSYISRLAFHTIFMVCDSEITENVAFTFAFARYIRYNHSLIRHNNTPDHEYRLRPPVIMQVNSYTSSNDSSVSLIMRRFRTSSSVSLHSRLKWISTINVVYPNLYSDTLGSSVSFLLYSPILTLPFIAYLG